MMNRGLLAAGAVLLLANGAILVNVARNRAGNPDAVVRLSERELRSQGTPEEGADEMLALRLDWDMAPGPGGATWFDRARLESLGASELPAEGDSSGSGRWPESNRRGYVVLELAGPAWDRWAAVAQARRDSTEAARKGVAGAIPALKPWLESEGATSSRLMAVDFGLDPVALREQYSDRSRYLILPSLYQAELIVATHDSSGAILRPARVEGRITQLLPGVAHVPRPLRDSLLALGAAKRDSTTHFAVNFVVGQRWEGWVE